MIVKVYRLVTSQSTLGVFLLKKLLEMISAGAGFSVSPTSAEVQFTANSVAYAYSAVVSFDRKSLELIVGDLNDVNVVGQLKTEFNLGGEVFEALAARDELWLPLTTQAPHVAHNLANFRLANFAVADAELVVTYAFLGV